MEAFNAQSFPWPFLAESLLLLLLLLLLPFAFGSGDVAVDEEADSDDTDEVDTFADDELFSHSLGIFQLAISCLIFRLS